MPLLQHIRSYKFIVLATLCLWFRPVLADKTEADSLLNIGAQYCEKGQLDEGISFLEQSIALAKKEKQWNVFAEATTYKWYAFYQKTGHADSSIQELKETLQLLEEKAPDSTDILADVHLFIGYFHYYIEELEESMRESELALELFERNKEKNLYNISAIYNNLGVLYSNFGNVDKAEDYIKKAISLRASFENSGQEYDKDNHLTNYLNLASLYYSAQRYEDYLMYLDLLKEEIDRLGQDASVLIRYKLNKQYLKYYLRQGKDLGKARNYISLCKELEERFPADGFDRVGTLQLTGEYYEKSGDTARAEEYFLRGTEEFIQWAGSNVGLTHEFIINLTEFYIRVGNFEEAKKWSAENLAVFYEENGKDIENMGTSELQTYAALLGTETCLHYFDKDGQPEIRNQSIDVHGRAYLETLRAYAARVEKIYSLEGYLDFETVLTALMLRKHDQNAENLSAIYEAMELMEIKQALPILKNRKDLNLMRMGGIPRETQQALKEIQVQLDKARALFKPGNEPEINNDIAAKISRLNEQKDSIKRIIQNQLERKGISWNHPLETHVDNELLLETVKKDECLLQFFNDRNELFILAFTHSGTAFYMQDDPELYDELAKLRAMMIEPEEYDADAFNSLSSSLYQKLVHPIREVLGDKNIVVMPTGTFNYIPFEVLRTPDNKYLIEERSIRYVYSVKTSKKAGQKAKGQPIAFAPDFSSEGDFGYAVRGDYQALEGAQKELSSIANHYSFSTYTNMRASKEAFVQAASESSIIHLATHAVVDERSPLRSYVVFDGDDSLDASDRNLYAYELYQMNLNAEMAVLSACNTGMGRMSTFDGVVSLAKAFENAGVHSTVMSLWPAQDESTSEIMASFYKYLAQGLKKSEALRLAKIDYLNSASGVRKNPFFWASFIIQGDDSPLPQKKNYWWWILGGVFILGSVYLVFRKVRSKASASSANS